MSTDFEYKLRELEITANQHFSTLIRIFEALFSRSRVCVIAIDSWLKVKVRDNMNFAYPLTIYNQDLQFKNPEIAKYFEFTEVSGYPIHVMYFGIKDEYLDKVDEIWTIMKLKGIL